MIQRIIFLALMLCVFPCFGALDNIKPKNWFCVYHKQRLFSVLKTSSDLVVVDPDAYKPFEIKFLKKTKKYVLAYLSIGEAEEYRSYFKKPEVKDLIINENPVWTGNFPVKYWEEKWF